ncbi:hypothetical protein D3C87_687620 [compost metagenome]
MSDGIQAVIGLGIFVVLCFILAHLARRYTSAKTPTAGSVAQQQLAESMLKLVEDTAWSEHFAASAAMHKKRIARLRAEGVDLPRADGKVPRSNYNPPPGYGRPPMPPSPAPQPSPIHTL